MQVWTFWQDLSQLKLRFPQDWTTMLNNSAVLQEMAREWAALVGMKPSDLLRLDRDAAVLSLHRDGVRICRRLDYLRDDMFTGGFDANERYALLSGNPSLRRTKNERDPK